MNNAKATNVCDLKGGDIIATANGNAEVFDTVATFGRKIRVKLIDGSSIVVAYDAVFARVN